MDRGRITVPGPFFTLCDQPAQEAPDQIELFRRRKPQHAADVLLVKTSRHFIHSPILPQKDRSFFVHFPGCAFFGGGLQYL
nr:MAG TPA: hypothetical protein [Caudoviricetes sp.]DAX58985.1 MAG TPA: hypothetical protein [Caudoviricetes sp.]